MVTTAVLELLLLLWFAQLKNTAKQELPNPQLTVYQELTLTKLDFKTKNTAWLVLLGSTAKMEASKETAKLGFTVKVEAILTVLTPLLT